MTVAAVIYSRNEADLLKACLPAVIGFDEVVVCDMQSTDTTRELAASAGARVVEVPDARVIEEVRQLGLDATGCDWVLFVDADEILPVGFDVHVRSMITADEQIVAYRLRYANVAFGRVLRHTLVGSAKYSLMRRDSSHFPHPGQAHIPPDFDGPVRDAPLDVPLILHMNFREVAQMTEKTLRYAADARGDAALLQPLALLRELMRASIFSGSWRDGYAGVAVSTSAVFGRWYSAALTAEREHRLTGDLPPRERIRLSVASRVQRLVVAVRRRGRAVLPRRGHRP